MFRRLLTPFDGSEVFRSSLAWAERVASHVSAEIELLRVIEPVGAPFSARPTPTLIALEARRQQVDREAAKVELGNLIHGLHARNINASRFVEMGTPAATILQFIDEHHIDLVVMGTHGRGGAKRAVLGSVADEISRKSPVPVLLIPPSSMPPIGTLTVLVCLDGSAASESALEGAAEFSQAVDGAITLLRVATGDDDEAAIIEDLNQVASGLSGRSVAIASPPLVRHGLPAVEILSAGASIGAAVIAIASHGRSGLPRVVLGSVASQVVCSSSLPVLLVRRARPMSG